MDSDAETFLILGVGIILGITITIIYFGHQVRQVISRNL